MSNIIDKIETIAEQTESQSININSVKCQLWYFKSIQSHLAFDFVKNNFKEIYTKGGILYLCNKYIPTISVTDLASADKVKNTLSQQYKADIVYLPEIPTLCENLTELAYSFIDKKIDFGKHRDKIISFLSNLSIISTFVPFEVEPNSLTGSLWDISDVSMLNHLLKTEYIPLLIDIGRLEGTPETIVPEVISKKLL